MHFIFQGAVEDQQVLAAGLETPGLTRCKSLLSRIHVTTINSSKDTELDHIIRLFTNYQLLKERNRKRVASVASRAFVGSPVLTSSHNASREQISFGSSMTNIGRKPSDAGIKSPPPAADPRLSGLGPSTTTGTGPSGNVSDSSHGDETPTLSGTDDSLPIVTRFKPTPQFTLATEPELLEPEVDHRQPLDVSATADEFNENTYRHLLPQFMTPLAESDHPKHQHDMFADDSSDMDSLLETTSLVDEYSSLSEMVSELVKSLPSFDFEEPEKAGSSVTQLNKSMLELEAAYLKVARRGPTKAPPANAPTSLKKNASKSNDMSESTEELEEEVSEADFSASLEQELVLKKYRQRYFRSEWNFVSTLTGISSLLKHMAFKTKEQKTKALRICLQEFNAEFARGVYMPILRRNGKTYRVIRIPYKEAFTLNSRDRVPYMMFIEAVSGDDLEDSPDLQTASHLLHQQQNATSSSLPSNSDFSSSMPDLDATKADAFANAPVVSIRDSEDQKVTKSLEKLEIIDEWVVVDKDTQVPEPQSLVDKIYKESWAKKSARVRKNSPVGNRKNWELISVVMKSGDDLRQEQLATQLIRLFYDIFQRSQLNLWVYPYEVLAVSSQGGFIETIPDALSIHTIKEELGADTSLRNYFNQAYGGKPQDLKKAKLNFIESLAAYSLICYIMQIKDRHNGNILLDTQGHLIHIDYGFMLTSSPGSLGFENAPFKLTVEFVEVMDGRNSPLYSYFRTLFQSGFLAIRQHHKSIMSIVQMMEAGSKMACFAKGPQTMKLLEDRFKIGLSEEEAIVFADELINYSEGNWRTDSYDAYQKLTNGIKV